MSLPKLSLIENQLIAAFTLTGDYVQEAQRQKRSVNLREAVVALSAWPPCSSLAVDELGQLICWKAMELAVPIELDGKMVFSDEELAHVETVVSGLRAFAGMIAGSRAAGDDLLADAIRLATDQTRAAMGQCLTRLGMYRLIMEVHLNRRVSRVSSGESEALSRTVQERAVPDHLRMQ